MDIIDSSIIVAFYRQHERQHQEAVNFIGSFSAITITEYILLEVATVLLLREDKTIAKQAVNLLTTSADIILLRLTESEFKETIDLFQNQKGTLSFADMSLVVLKNMRKATIHTFDKALKRALI